MPHFGSPYYTARIYLMAIISTTDGHHGGAGDDGADAKQGRLDPLAFYSKWFSTLDLVRLKDAEWMFWKDSKCRCFEADLWNFGFELLSGPNEDLDDLFLQMSKRC